MPDEETFSSRLKLLKEDIEAVEFKDLPIIHPSRAYITMWFSTVPSSAALTKWRKISTVNQRTGELDAQKYNGLVLANLNTRIDVHGEELLDDEGQPATFRTPAFLQEFEVLTAAAVAAAFVKNDVQLGAIANKILETAGIGKELEDGEQPPNPT